MAFVSDEGTDGPPASGPSPCTGEAPMSMSEPAATSVAVAGGQPRQCRGIAALALDVSGLTKRYPGPSRFATSTSNCAKARSERFWARTAPASRRSSETLSGTIHRDDGTIRVAGTEVTIGDRSRRGPGHRHGPPGIAAVSRPQRPREHHPRPLRPLGCGLAPRRRTRWLEQPLAQIDTHVDLDAKVSSLSTRDQQLVAIAKALTFDPRVLILDEPTSALVAEDVDTLLALVTGSQSRAWPSSMSRIASTRFPGGPRGDGLAQRGACRARWTSPRLRPVEIVEMMVGRSLGQARRRKAPPRSAWPCGSSDLHTDKHRGLDLVRPPW